MAAFVFRTRVEGEWKGAFFKARVVLKNADGSFKIRWDAGSVTSSIAADRLRAIADEGDHPLPKVYVDKYAAAWPEPEPEPACDEDEDAGDVGGLFDDGDGDDEW